MYFFSQYEFDKYEKDIKRYNDRLYYSLLKGHPDYFERCELKRQKEWLAKEYAECYDFPYFEIIDDYVDYISRMDNDPYNVISFGTFLSYAENTEDTLKPIAHNSSDLSTSSKPK